VEFVSRNLRFASGNDPMGKLMLTLLAAFAEFERSMIRSRQPEGISMAKAKGVYVKPKALTAERVEQLRRRAALGATKAALSREFGVSRPTVCSYLRMRDIDRRGVLLRRHTSHCSR